MRAARGLDFRIEIDGGIDLATIGPSVRAGVEILVAGSHVFGRGDPARKVEGLLQGGAGSHLVARLVTAGVERSISQRCLGCFVASS